MSSRSAADALRALSLGPASSQAPEKVLTADERKKLKNKLKKQRQKQRKREQADAEPSIAVGARIALPRLVPDKNDLNLSRSCHAPGCNKPICLQCTRCMVARYCSHECFNRDAPRHKHLCRPKVGDTPALASACIGVVEGVAEGDRVVVKLDSGPRVIIGAESITSRGGVTATDAADATSIEAPADFGRALGRARRAARDRRVREGLPARGALARAADEWFREEAWVNILSFLDGRTLAQFVLASRRADVRRWAEAQVERTVAAVAVRAPALLATRHEAEPLIRWLATTVEPQLAGDFEPRPLPLDRVGDCVVSLYCLFAACPLESFLRAEGWPPHWLGRGVEEYAALEAYVNRTGGPDGPDGARALLTTLRESNSNMPAEGQPGDAMDVFLIIFSHLDDILQRKPCDRPATLESSHYDADDAKAVLTAVQKQVGVRPDGVLAAATGHYERQVRKYDHPVSRNGVPTEDLDVVQPGGLLRLDARRGASIYDMIDAAVAQEQFSGDSDGTIQRTIWCTGRVLVFNLNLVHWDGATESWRFNDELLDDPISFPVEGLDMMRYVDRPAPSETFDLVGAVFYLTFEGRPRGGHCVAATYHELSRQWFLFDDDRVERLDSLEAYAAGARGAPQLLFYRRRPAAARPLK